MMKKLFLAYVPDKQFFIQASEWYLLVRNLVYLNTSVFFVAKNTELIRLGALRNSSWSSLFELKGCFVLFFTNCQSYKDMPAGP